MQGRPDKGRDQFGHRVTHHPGIATGDPGDQVSASGGLHPRGGQCDGPFDDPPTMSARMPSPMRATPIAAPPFSVAVMIPARPTNKASR